jgi:hypothetical protein
VTTSLRRAAPARRAQPFVVAAVAGLLLSTIACDRWKAPFRGEHIAAAEVSPRTPLPASGFRVRWDPHTVPATMERGSSADVRIAFTNLSDVVWPDVASANPAAHDGGYAVRLAYQWTPAPGPGGPGAGRPGRRADLPRPVRPGDTMTLLLPLQAPDQPGTYHVTFTLLQELVVWFDDKGAPTLVVPVTVK